jgi:hypothetical protein
MLIDGRDACCVRRSVAVGLIAEDANGHRHAYTIKEQVELFSRHGVVVAPHGAGLVNQMFMAPLSAVVELFPYHIDHTVYPVMGANLGVGNYPVHTTNGTAIRALSKVGSSYAYCRDRGEPTLPRCMCVCVCLSVSLSVCAGL